MTYRPGAPRTAGSNCSPRVSARGMLCAVTQHLPIVVRSAKKSDRPRLANALTDAFSEDPVFLHMLPADISKRQARLRRFFTLELPRSEGLGGAWTTSDTAGAAVWFPPNRWKPPWWHSLRQTPGMLRVFGPQAQRAGRVLTTMQDHHPRRPHWYLLYVGTVAGRRGSGVGSALLRPVLELCDTQAIPAYLEATNERNRSLYLRHGFTDLAPLQLPDGGPVVLPMWREPR